MNTKQYTPGPWTLTTVHTPCGICHKIGEFPGQYPDDRPRSAWLYADFPSRGNSADEELEANARLIAAAPELLEALQEIADCGAEAWGEDRPCVRIARDAIAKATGETQ